MWLKIKDRETEYVVNFNNIICFAKTTNCKHEPCIELVITQGGINLVYNTEEHRDYIYESIIDKVQSIRMEI
jgi:hypothetical protein